MSCFSTGANAFEVKWQKLDEIVDNCFGLAFDQCNTIYGSPADMIANTGDPIVLDYELSERIIFFEKTLEFIYNVQLQNLGTYTTHHSGDDLKDIKNLKNVVCLD